MTKNKNIISEILNRKIPQIIGMYIGSVWLLVEISNWMSGRFKLPAQFDTYVFVFLLSLLPAVIIIAWGHGKSGADSWSKFELSWIPLNLTFAIFAAIYFVKPISEKQLAQAKIEPEKAEIMQKLSVIDAETGKKVTYEVANQAYHQSVISFFFDNNTQHNDNDWLSYGAGWLLSQDLKRTPLLSVITPYNSRKLFSSLVAKGFKNALNIPLALALKIAGNRSIDWIIMGSFDRVNKNYTFNGELYNVKTGELVNKFSAENKNPLKAIDTISDNFSHEILKAINIHDNVIPQLAISDHTSNNIDAIKNYIAAKNTALFENNYQKSNHLIQLALEKDQTFADAHLLAVDNYNALGDVDASIKHIKAALKFDYKLYQESVFIIKATLFAYNGQQEKSIKILENLVKLYPRSVNSLRTLARYYFQIGHHQQKAKEIYLKIVDLEGAQSTALIELGKIERLKNNKDKAIEYLQKYLKANPAKSQAFFELGDAYLQFGLMSQAQEMYEEASLFDNKDFRSEIGLATIIASKGDYKKALTQLNALLKQAETANQKLKIYASITDILLLTGQIKQALKNMQSIGFIAKTSMPPLASIFQVEGTKIYLFTMIGNYKAAQEIIDKISHDLKPPYDLLVGAFSKFMYEKRKDSQRFTKALALEEQFVEKFNSATMLPDILYSKALLQFWQKNDEKAYDLIQQAITEAKQSFVTLITTKQIDSISYLKAEILTNQQKFTQALKELDIILQRTPLFARAHLLKAQIYQKQNLDAKKNAEIKAAEKIWQDADTEFIDLKYLQNFNKS